MDQEEAVAFIIDRIAKHDSHNDIAMDLCEQWGMDWEAAEELIRQVEENFSRVVAVRQSPFLIFLGIAVLIGGTALFAAGIYYFLFLVDFRSLEQLLDFQTTYFMGGSVVVGMALIAGSIVGLSKILAEL